MSARSKRLRGVFVVLMGVLVAVSLRPSAAAETRPPALARNDSLASKRAEQRQRALLLTWSRDPFAGTATSSATTPRKSLVLSGILWDPRQPLALINGKTVQVGEEIEGYRILEITHDSVSVTDGTHTSQLHLAP